MSDDFKDFEPSNLGSYVDVNPKRADERAMDAVKVYIDGLVQKISALENLRDVQSNIILDLCKELRARAEDDFVLLPRLDALEESVRKL